MPSPPALIRLLIADDHELIREGFCNILKNDTAIRIVGEARDGAELIKLTEKLNPDIIITDIGMPELNGIEATKLLVKKYPKINIIAYTMFQHEHLIIQMLEAGAKGYLTKNSSKEELLEAIKTVLDHKTYYCRDTTATLARMIAKSKFKTNVKPGYEFSKRETDIIKMICEEQPNKEIAAALNLGIRTVEGYRKKIEEKMNVKNAAGIVVYAIRTGIYKVSYDM